RQSSAKDSSRQACTGPSAAPTPSSPCAAKKPAAPGKPSATPRTLRPAAPDQPQPEDDLPYLQNCRAPRAKRATEPGPALAGRFRHVSGKVHARFSTVHSETIDSGQSPQG